MDKEIERKFLLTGDDWRQGDGTHFLQAYLSIDKERTVRIRGEGDAARLTIKGITLNATRDEYEYPPPVSDAHALLEDLCMRPLIEKRRYRIEYREMVWKVDDFRGDNVSLRVAEIELEFTWQAFASPPWLGEEVTDDPRYYNDSLVRKPFSRLHQADDN